MRVYMKQNKTNEVDMLHFRYDKPKYCLGLLDFINKTKVYFEASKLIYRYEMLTKKLPNFFVNLIIELVNVKLNEVFSIIDLA